MRCARFGSFRQGFYTLQANKRQLSHIHIERVRLVQCLVSRVLRTNHPSV